MATINTRIKLRYDQYANWVAKDPVLYSGEVAVAVAPAEAGTGLHEPCVTMKVGDGTSKYSELSFITALAGDVLTACKTTEGLTKFINDVLVDAGVLSGDEVGEGKSLAERVTDAEGAIDALKKADEEIRAEIAAKISTTYKASGSVANAEALPEPSATTLGNVYHVSENFVTTDKFIEGAGKTVPAGSNVVIVETKAAVPGTPADEEAGTPEVPGTPAEYGYDVVGSFIDLSDYYTKEETDALIPEAVKDALTPQQVPVDPDNPDAGTTTEKSPLLEKVEEIVNSAVDKLDYADEGVESQFVWSVKQTDGLIEVVRKAIETKDVTGLEKEIQTVIKESLTKPADPVDPANPTEEETAAKELYESIMKEVEKLINDALNGKDGADGENGALEETIKKIVEEAIKDMGGTPVDPSDPDGEKTPPSALNTAVKEVIEAELGKLDYTNDDEGVVTSVSQENGLISVVKKVLTSADVTDFIQGVIEATKKPEGQPDPDNPGETLPPTAEEEKNYKDLVDNIVNIVLQELAKNPGTNPEDPEIPVNQEFYDSIKEIVKEMINEALKGENGSDGEDGKDGLTQTIEEIINKLLKDEGDSTTDPENPTPPSELNTTVNNMIDKKLDALDVEDTAVENEFVTSVSQVNGKIVVTRGPIHMDQIVQDPDDSEIILGGGGA